MAIRVKRLIVQASLLVMGLAGVAQAQTSSGGPQICPPFCDFLTPTFIDFIFPGLSTRC